MTGAPLASYEYLAETTRAILNMVARNLLVRYPDLKVVVPHCGSFLPNAMPRFKGLLPVMIKQGTADIVKSLKLARRENSTKLS